MVSLSILLPAYNEERILAGSLARLGAFLDGPDREALSPWEIVVVDDGSADATAEIAQRASGADPRIRLVRLPRNLGKGAALKEGILSSRGERLVATDVDLSYALEDIGSVARRLAAADPPERRPDIVAGDRRHPESRLDLLLAAIGHVARRQAISYAFNRLVRIGFGLPWRDTQCGLKGFQREAALRVAGKLRTRRFLADIEIFVIARQCGMRVETVPVHLTYLSGDSTVRVAREIVSVARDAARIRLAQALGRYRDAPRPERADQGRESTGT